MSDSENEHRAGRRADHRARHDTWASAASGSATPARDRSARHGVRDTGPVEPAEDDDVPPEQRPGAVEENPVGIEPKAGYPSLDPRSQDD